jgi:hypothetical protein
MAKLEDAAIADIDSAIKSWMELRAGSSYEDSSDKPEEERAYVVDRLSSTIDRLAPKSSYYAVRLIKILKRDGFIGYSLPELIGLIKALKQDISDGHLRRFESLVQSDMFSDFLDMAHHLISNGYKDAAAVISGSVLEQHLRKICDKNNIAISAGDKPKKADGLNAELAGAGSISKLDQKQITAWLGLRNHAAHGEYEKYSIEEVRIMSQGIMNFMSQHPT